MENDIRDNPAMTRFEMPLYDSARSQSPTTRSKTVASSSSTEVPQELFGLGYGSRLAHWRFRSVATRREKSDREEPLHFLLRRPAPRVRRTPRQLIADGWDAGAHSAFGQRYLPPIECISKGNF